MVDVIDMSKTTMPVGKQAFFWVGEVKPRNFWMVDVRYSLVGAPKDKNKNTVLFSASWRFGGSENSTKTQILEQLQHRANEYRSPGKKRKIKILYITGFHWPCFGSDFEHMLEISAKLQREVDRMKEKREAMAV